ncbi:hypothetical protein DFH11DRAFT_1842639 [Phellopilus nigrolimitatus]|nr:hypothetical protein DFH11DRAFT_1842639 [Phellopilus nigrolimitatus]
MATRMPPTASMADTRLPFKGTLAFDRNSQDYVPFRTQTDAMLASLMLAYRLAPPILTVVLAITLEKAEDVRARVAEREAQLVNLERANRNGCFPFAFPRVVLEEVIDLLAEERRMELYAQRDVDGPHMGRIEPEKMDRDLRSMSLVCKDWTRSAQHALGRVLALQDVRKPQVLKALNSPLFGRWTREIVLFRHFRDLDAKGRSSLNESSGELWTLMARLFAHVPNARSLSLSSDRNEMSIPQVTESFIRMPSLRELRVIHAGDITQLLGTLCKKMSLLPSLEHLFLQYSGSGSCVHQIRAPVGARGLARALVSQTVAQDRQCERSFAFNGFRLRSLSLDLSCCYYNERMCISALEPCFRTLEELHVNLSGLGEGMLTSVLKRCGVLRRLSLNSMLEGLPDTLEDLCVDFSFESADWALWDRHTCSFLSKRNMLKRLAVRPVWFRGPGEESIDRIYPESKALCKELGIDASFAWSTMDDQRWSS